MAKNIYTHVIDLEPLKIINAPRKEFAKELTNIPYRGYEVEQISDGRKIVIAKPGGKSIYGKPLKEDFFVFIYNPKDNSLWQISHKQIYEDLEIKSNFYIKETLNVLKLFERVYYGDEPDKILTELKFTFSTGESIEVLLKAYKWIWGQEDVNYPNGEGRDMSFKGLKELMIKLEDSIK